MKRFGVAFFSLVFLLSALGLSPSAAFADTSITGKTDCPAGTSSGDPSGQQSFGTDAASATAIQSYMYKVESCASACFDENVSVQVSVLPLPSVTVVVKGTNQCKATPVTQPAKAQPPRGCAAGQSQPQITLSVPDVSLLGTTYMKQQRIGPKSRCYGAVASTVSSLTKGGLSGMSNPAAIQSNFDNLNALSSEAPQGAAAPVQSTIQGNEQLIQALTATGISSGDAQKLASDPSSAQALINAYATGNTNTIQDTVQDAAAKAGINLNNDIYDNISNLSPAQVQTAQTALSPLADQSGTVITGDTFQPASNAQAPAQPLKGGANAAMIAAAEQQYNLPTGLLGNICNSESRCTSVCSGSSSACGMYQYTSSTWTGVTTQMCSQGISTIVQYCSGGSISTSLRSDPYIATQVAGWNISQNLQQYGSLIAQTGVDQSTAAYIMQGLGTGGAQKFFQAYIQNPNMSTADFLYQTQPGSAAAILATNGHLYAGQTLQGTVNQFAANLGAAPASTAPVGSAVTGAGSPFSISTGALGSALLGSNITSPFANVSPYYSAPGLGSTAALPIQSIQYAQPVQQPAQTVQTVPTQQVTGTSQTPASSGQTGVAVAQIIAQPKSVAVGAPITVSWSSAGMSAASPCKVMEDGIVVAALNEGAQIVTATSTGQLSFSLSCTPSVSGAIVTSKASVLVQ